MGEGTGNYPGDVTDSIRLVDHGVSAPRNRHSKELVSTKREHAYYHP